jgi:hypothetical protein
MERPPGNMRSAPRVDTSARRGGHSEPSGTRTLFSGQASEPRKRTSSQPDPVILSCRDMRSNPTCAVEERAKECFPMSRASASVSPECESLWENPGSTLPLLSHPHPIRGNRETWTITVLCLTTCPPFPHVDGGGRIRMGEIPCAESKGGPGASCSKCRFIFMRAG